MPTRSENKETKTGGSNDYQKSPDSADAQGSSCLLGKFNVVSQAIPPGPLFCRAIQRDLAAALEASNECYETPCRLSPAAIEELEWWNNQLTTWNGKSGAEAAGPSDRVGCLPDK